MERMDRLMSMKTHKTIIGESSRVASLFAARTSVERKGVPKADLQRLL
jgi:hypothetical protein